MIVLQISLYIYDIPIVFVVYICAYTLSFKLIIESIYIDRAGIIALKPSF
jgi:hypothetical protein